MSSNEWKNRLHFLGKFPSQARDAMLCDALQNWRRWSKLIRGTCMRMSVYRIVLTNLLDVFAGTLCRQQIREIGRIECPTGDFDAMQFLALILMANLGSYICICTCMQRQVRLSLRYLLVQNSSNAVPWAGGMDWRNQSVPW
jgi:hypothetical protein